MPDRTALSRDPNVGPVLPAKVRKARAGAYRYLVETWDPGGHRVRVPEIVESKLPMHQYAELVIDDLSCIHPPMTTPKLARGRVRVSLEEDQTLFIEQSWAGPQPSPVGRR